MDIAEFYVQVCSRVIVLLNQAEVLQLFPLSRTFEQHMCKL
jgi:hypothetical protein